jgi:hypothetical protein
MVIRLLVVVMGLLLTTGLHSASAQEISAPRAQAPGQLQGTPDEQAACHRDAIKLCREVLSDTFAVLGCLKANRPKLTQACRTVLQNHGQ